MKLVRTHTVTVLLEPASLLQRLRRPRVTVEFDGQPIRLAPGDRAMVTFTSEINLDQDWTIRPDPPTQPDRQLPDAWTETRRPEWFM